MLLEVPRRLPGLHHERGRETRELRGVRRAGRPERRGELRHLPQALAELVQPTDLVMTLGAGDVTLVGPLLVEQLEGRS